MSSKANNLFTEISTFFSDFDKDITTVTNFCDIVPSPPSFSFVIVNLPAYIFFVLSAPVRYPICILLSGISALECPQCILYNLFPFLSLINLFTPGETNCLAFSCTCATSSSPCGPTPGTGPDTSGITSLFYCKGQPCPSSYINYAICVIGYSFLAPFSPIIDLFNFGLEAIFHKSIYFSFNCPLPPGETS
jgi:hypothetical protein